MVEGCRRPREVCYVVGGRIGICLGGCVFHQSLLFPELCHSLQFAGEIITHWRLPLREQDELWTTHSANTAHHAADTTHHAGFQHKELCRMASLGL